jgi:hypothetical protein
VLICSFPILEYTFFIGLYVNFIMQITDYLHSIKNRWSFKLNLNYFAIAGNIVIEFSFFTL